MELELDIFQKLVNANAIDIADFQPETMSDSIVLDRDTATQFENGVVVARYIEYVVSMMDREWVSETNIDTSSLRQMKQDNGSSAKYFNWNIIFKEASKLGITVDSDSKELIIAGDPVMIIDLVKRVAEYIEEKVGSPRAEKQTKKTPARKKKVKEGVDILSMDPNKKPSKCESSLEIILNTLCRNFKMKPKQ
jgi:hypothetical protein